MSLLLLQLLLTKLINMASSIACLLSGPILQRVQVSSSSHGCKWPLLESLLLLLLLLPLDRILK
jgi:hypothetical protein